MPYVERAADGAIKGAYANEQPGYAEEWLPDDDATVIAFRAPPLPPASMTPLEFIDRLTDAEQLALATAAMSQAPIKLWYDKLLAADTVNLGDARLAQGVQAMVAAGLLAAPRALEILGQA